jgi:hypothetical protein
MESSNIMLPYRFVKDTSPALFLGRDAAGPDIGDDASSM